MTFFDNLLVGTKMQRITMPQGLSLRLATASDQAFLADLFRQTHTFLYAIDQAREATDVLINQQQQWFLDIMHFHFIQQKTGI